MEKEHPEILDHFFKAIYIWAEVYLFFKIPLFNLYIYIT